VAGMAVKEAVERAEEEGMAMRAWAVARVVAEVLCRALTAARRDRRNARSNGQRT